MAVVKAKKRIGSKKTKKAWRKTDIQDVEDYLEDKRLEERLGISFQDSKNEDLFTVDNTPDNKNLEKYEDFIKDRRSKILKKPPRCFQNLEPDSKVPDPVLKRNRVRTPDERKHPLLRLKEADLKAKGVLKAKEIQRLQNKHLAAQRKKNKLQRGDVVKDLWDEDEPLPADLASEWVKDGTREYTILNTKLKESVIRYKKRSNPSTIAAIETPHPGVSYNPTFSAHTELLQAVASKEMELMKKDAHLARVTSKMFKKVPRAQAEAEWMREMSQGVPALDPEAVESDEDSADDTDFKAINPPTTRDKKKDLKTRRKEKERKRELFQRNQAKLEKKKISDLHILKHIQKDLTEAEEKVNSISKKRQEIKEATAGNTRRLGLRRFEDRGLDFNFASDLKGSLRSIKPQGNLLADRYTSMQKRNIMAVPALKLTRLAKKKTFKKASHKMDWEINPLERPAHLRKKMSKNTAVLGQK